MKLRGILEELRSGRISVEEAEKRIRLFALAEVEELAKLDIGREMRVNKPEAILAEGKDPRELVRLVKEGFEAKGAVLVTRLCEEHVKALRELEGELLLNPKARAAIIKRKGYELEKKGVKVGILAAGTADIPTAEEAALTLEFLGIETIKSYDVGVAGLHRLFKPLREMLEAGVIALIVMAGMEGALPSIVASLTDVPVIGVPTSVGYGLGKDGIAALSTMLQTCSSGIAVVNIDNGFGAAVFAALIAEVVLRR